ncbi:hypothetical protein SAVIM338S_02861 [Streptomyces avidinii]
MLAARGEVTGLSLRGGRVRAGKVARLSYVRLPVPAVRNWIAAESPNRRP